MPTSFNYTPSKIAGSSSDGGGGGIGIGDVLTSPLHFTENLLKDVGTAAIGTPGGVYHLLTDPEDAIPAIAKGIADDWAPLVTGHPIEFAKHFYEHPLGPILDIAAIFTGGAAAAGRSARLLSGAEYAGVTARGAAKAGLKGTTKRAIVEGGSKPGTFAKRIAEPTWADRLAAYSREGSRTLEAYDTVGAKGRINVGAEARLPIPYQTGKGVAAKLRAEQFDKLRDSFASRGGTLGGIAQWSYEQKALGRLSGTIAALGHQMGVTDRFLKQIYDPATGQAKYHGMQKFADDWYDRIAMHAVGTGRYIEAGTKFNEKSYGALSTRKSMTRTVSHYKKDGEVETRAWGTGGHDAVYKDVAQLGRRVSNKKFRETFSGKDLIEKWGADASKVDPSKRYHILTDKHTMRNMGVDAGKQTRMLMRGYLRGTSIWKSIILGFSPRFFLNNLLGNGLMYSFNYAGSGALFGIREHIKYTKGKQALMDADADMATAILEANPFGIIDKHFSDQAGQAFHDVAASERMARAHRGTAMEQPGRRPQGRLEKATARQFKWAGKYAEQPYRIGAIMIELRADSRVAAMMKKLHKENPKWTRDKLFNESAMRVLDKNPDLVRSIRKSVEDVMGDYHTLTGPERSLRNISPFYTWQRHITRNSFHMALDKPIRTALAARVGTEGAAWTTEQLGGNIPNFAQGLIPFGDENMQDGVPRRGVLSTASFNPWAQVGELARTGASVLGVASGGDTPTMGETVGSLLNPLAVGGMEALFGQSLFTGAPKSSRAALLSPLTGLPQFRLGKQIISPDTFTSPTLYKKDPMTEFLALLGLSKKELYQGKLAQLGIAEKEGR